ncbi:MAG: hypothetical protein FJ387_07310 [Verrucomicrobia bacterium]|nr:hypothetical protein [Verrucomicrobiota bacterium]
MTLLPIVGRELRVGARRSKTYWLRLAAAGAAFLVCLWLGLWALKDQPPVTVGKTLFSYLTVLAFAYCLLVGPFITADCVSEEKRDGTLGLLFLTELRSYDVVLGKWFATSLTGLYGLLAILPALGLPLLLGGVTPGEYGRVALSVVNAILFSLTAGMLVSTLSRDQGKATLGTVVLILGLTGLLPGLSTVVITGFFTKPLNQFPAVALASPAYTGYLALDTAFRAAPKNYWLSLGLVHGLCWGFMIATAVLVPRMWREHPADKPTTQRWFWRFGYTAGWRRAFRRRLERNPIQALAARLRWPHVVFWLLVGLVAVNVYWLTYGYRRAASTFQFHQYFSYALVFTNRVWVAVMACRFLLEARRAGALELILTTPLSVVTFLRGHWRALRGVFFWPVVAIAVLHVLYVEESWRLSRAPGPVLAATAKYYIAAAASSLVNFTTDVLALCWVGAWLSVASRRPNLAILKTFALVILIPWTLGYAFPRLSTLVPQTWLAYAASKPFLQFFLGPTAFGYSLVRPLVWVSKNLLLVLWARHGLRRHFRAAAAQTYGQDRWWRRQGRALARRVVPPRPDLQAQPGRPQPGVGSARVESPVGEWAEPAP